MPHILDNMIWNAITTGNRDIAIVDGNAGYYYPDIAPFGALKEWDDKNLEQLYQLAPLGKRVFVSYPGGMMLDENKWKQVVSMDCCQMVYEHPVNNFTTSAGSGIKSLSIEDVPQMMELTELTKPGPFFEKTILFGNYFGIFIDDRLVAMAGQRMHPVPYMEVSAVCTHPDFRGNGYAKTLMLHVMKIILDNSFIPFLHVLANNTNAIQLYQTIGFQTRKRLFISIIEKV